MNLKTYAKYLNELLNESPELGELHVVTAIDDEGNGFNLVHCRPSVGSFNADTSEFHETEGIKDLIEDGHKPEDFPINAVCLN